MATGVTTSTPLIVITGPTASGKTALAIRLARQFGGEIISADSRTVYRGMDIATAKPTVEERQGVPHWGFDMVDPGEYFSVADFQRYAIQKIAEIRSRGAVPFLVGGTGLYIDAVVFDFSFGTRPSMKLRSALEAMSVEELQKYCKKNNILVPQNKNNKRHLTRHIERNGISGIRKLAVAEHTYVVGITTEKEKLRANIESRVEQQISQGIVDEAISVGDIYGRESQAMTSNAYPIVHRHLMGQLSNDQLRDQMVICDYRLVKRQMTWLRRNSWLLWGDLSTVEQYLSNILAHQYKL